MSGRPPATGSHKLKMSYILNKTDNNRSQRPDPMDIDTQPGSSRQHHPSHADEKERKHPCSHCQQRFLSRGDLQKHINIVHLRIKKHTCAACGLKFGEKGNLTKHEKRKHRSDREFKCQVERCGKTFVLRDGLVRHEKQVHKIGSSSASTSRHTPGSSSNDRSSSSKSDAANRYRK